MTTQDDATPSGVSANENAATPGEIPPQPDDNLDSPAPAERPRSRREDALEAIERARREQFERESGVQLESPAPPEPPAPEPQPDEDGDQLQQQLAADGARISGDDLKKLVSLKVFGEEKVVPLEEALRIAQKQEAADRRLAEANERFRVAEEMLQQLQTARPGLPDSETPANNTSNPAADPSAQQTVKAKVKEAIDAVFRGDEEASAERLAQVILEVAKGQAPATQVDPTQVAQLVTAQLEQQSVSKDFLAQYPMFGAQQDPNAEFKASYMRSMHQQRVQAYLNEGVDYRTAVMQAGQDTYRDFGIQPPQAGAGAAGSQQTASRSQELANRKAQLGSIPAGRTASAAPSGAPVESSEQVRASTIAEMAASRRPTNPIYGRPPARR